MAITIAGKRYFLPARRLWLCVPILLPFILDASMTLIGQSSHYWGSGYHYVDEANPLAHWLMHLHPLVYVNSQILLFCFYILMVEVLPTRWAKIFTVFCTVGHTYGWFSWLKYVLQVNYFVRFGIIAIPALLLVYAFDRVDDVIQPG